MQKANRHTTYSGNTTANQGFTLVELLIGSMIFTFLIVGVLALQQLLSQGENFGLNTAFNVDNAESALIDLGAELRYAHSSETGAYPLELDTIPANSIQNYESYAFAWYKGEISGLIHIVSFINGPAPPGSSSIVAPEHLRQGVKWSDGVPFTKSYITRFARDSRHHEIS